VLLYLFWEPENWIDFTVFHKHREEIVDFSSHVEGTSVRFMAQSYPEMWAEWENQNGTTKHISALRSRYQFPI
jgi:hypothetical protein